MELHTSQRNKATVGSEKELTEKTEVNNWDFGKGDEDEENDRKMRRAKRALDKTADAIYAY